MWGFSSCIYVDTGGYLSVVLKIEQKGPSSEFPLSYYGNDKILHKREVCYLGSGGVMLSMQQSTLINHIEYKLDKLSVSRQMCE